MSFDLVNELTARKDWITGTLRANRIGKSPIKDVAAVKIEEGEIHEVACDSSSKMSVCPLQDNSVVAMVTNCDGVLKVRKKENTNRIAFFNFGGNDVKNEATFCQKQDFFFLIICRG